MATSHSKNSKQHSSNRVAMKVGSKREYFFLGDLQNDLHLVKFKDQLHIVPCDELLRSHKTCISIGFYSFECLNKYQNESLLAILIAYQNSLDVIF